MKSLEFEKLTWHHVILFLILMVFIAMSISAGKPWHLDFKLAWNGIQALNESYIKATAKQYPEINAERLDLLDAYVAEKLTGLGFEQDAKPYIESQQTKLNDTNIARALSASNSSELDAIIGKPHEIKDFETHKEWVWVLPDTQERLSFHIDETGKITNASLEN
jgi:hypothetical protein